MCAGHIARDDACVTPPPRRAHDEAHLMNPCAWLAAHGSSCLEAVAVVFGIVSVYLSTRENIWSWPTALVNVALFTVLFLRSGLYSDTGLQVVYFGLSVYGWYEWLYGGAGHTAIAVSRTSARSWVILAVVAVVMWGALGAITSRLPGTALPYVDAATTTVSLIAQWMMTRKQLENWVLWIAVDIVYIGMFIFKGLYLTAVNYGIYLVLAVMGYVSWKRSFAAESAANAEAATA
jgi:nicotinamide mononucleotide transporter